jgi:multidrug transporter EmrE-like cation transporter
LTTPISSMAWVATGAFIGSFGAVGLKAGAKRLEYSIVGLLSNWRLAGGIVAYLLSSVFFVKGVSNGELSILYPMVSVGSLWTLLWSRIFFQEPWTRSKVIGISLILAGVGLLGLGSR